MTPASSSVVRPIRLPRDNEPGRHAWIQIIEGVVEIDGRLLSEGRREAVDDPPEPVVNGVSDWSGVLLFDLA